MGGFAISIPQDPHKHDEFVPPARRGTWFVSGQGCALLAQLSGTAENVIPDLREEEIKAKSKANGLAKSLVCFQALWFITTCMTRRTYG